MDKDVKPYKQKGSTCAIACLMMILEYYKQIPKADWNYEKQYYKAYRSKYMDGTPFSAIAYHLAKNNFEVELIHSDKNLFHKNNVIEDYIFNGAMEEYKEYLEGAKKYGLKIKTGIDLNHKMLKQYLEKGKMIILALEFGTCLHAILLTGYEEDSFIVCDPQYKQKQKMTFTEIDDFMNTSLGKWCIVVGPNELE